MKLVCFAIKHDNDKEKNKNWKLISLFLSLGKYLLSVYSIPRTVPDTKDTAVNKKRNFYSTSMETRF